ncbi:MAG: hypothetical protein NVS9B13_23500 [Candidatus Acidiferrum sp.]
MFRRGYTVKFVASEVCPICNLRTRRTGRIHWGQETMSAFQEHKEELEHYEQMFGRDRGRLAVSLDRLTNALVLVGQHGIYCTSQRTPTVPAMDVRMVVKELVHAKELVQAVMEEMRKERSSLQQGRG